MQILADAIDRAGSVDRAGSIDPDKIRAALVATEVPGDQLIVPWRGVKFDETDQNVWATPVIQQVEGGKYHTVYPFDIAVQPPVWNVGR